MLGRKLSREELQSLKNEMKHSAKEMDNLINKRVRIMSWDHRVIKRTVDGTTSYQLHEVYYDGDEISGWTEDPVAAMGESAGDLKSTLKLQQNALDKPFLVEVGAGDAERLEEIDL